MQHTSLRAAAIAACSALSFSLAAQEVQPSEKSFRSPSVIAYAPGKGGQLVLKYGTFDPTGAHPAVPAALHATADNRLFVVQFTKSPEQADRDAIVGLGGEIHGFLPHDAYVVRMSAATAAAVDELQSTRFVGPYQPAWRLEPALLAEHVAGALVPTRDYNIVVVDKRRDKPALAQATQALGGIVVDAQEGGLLMTVRLDGAQLIRAAHLEQVLWIDRWTAPELDIDNGRIQGGANYVESNLGYSGQGVRGHVYEGVESNHPDFTTPFVNVASGGGADTHGHATAGIVFGNGTSNPAVRGMAPDAVGFYTQYSSAIGSRNSIIQQVVNTHQAMFTTASWGGGRTLDYTSESADSDDVVFDHRIPWTQSQSNAGNQMSRPQAWAKNVFSIGGVAHRDNALASDDSWAGGGGSTGPAADGRIKPDLSAYYDGIGTSDRTGSAGYSSGDWSSSFGGTSGATPMVAGHNAIAIQMFTEGLFGNPLRVPGGTRFQNRPLAQTLKALMIANAQQYAFNAGSSDNRREHVGWGFPSLRNLYDNQNRMLIVAEDDVVTQGTTRTYSVTVAPGEPELKVSMTFLDPAGNPAAALTRINDLSLRVTSPTGTIYWGNNGLTAGNYSTSGGVANTIDTVENVFVQNPAAGTWTIDVIATQIVQDAHVATGTVDATYALCAVGVNATGVIARATNYGTGCGAASTSTLPSTFYEVFGSFDLANSARRFVPSGGGNWAITQTGAAFDPNFANSLGLSDDQISRGHALGFSFPLAGGGSTTAIDVDSNGWIGLIANQHGGSDYTESPGEFVGNPARIAALWDDLNPGSGGGVYFDTFPGRAVITWNAVPEFSATGANTLQIQLFPSGEFVLAYGAVSAADGLVGYSQGGVADPGTNDISNPSGGAPLSIGASPAPRLGATVQLEVGALSPTTITGVIALGFTQLSVDLSFLGATDCFLLTAFDLNLSPVIAGASAIASFSIPNDVGLLGLQAFAQGAFIDPPANPFGVLTSNGVALTFGS